MSDFCIVEYEDGSRDFQYWPEGEGGETRPEMRLVRRLTNEDVTRLLDAGDYQWLAEWREKT